jgi:alginate O-acetyltransferase complex protein AlgI
MIFNSIEFAIFLPIIFGLYWFVTNKNLTLQNALLVAASYLFYGWWDYRFLALIVFSSILDYIIGIYLGKEEHKRKRKRLLATSLFVNLGFLGIFKYFNFFAESFANAFTFFGTHIEPTQLNIILPVGISFYTFQTLSYSIDVYRRQLEPCREPISFLAFVSFFPQLVAGPIERATNLLPQFYLKRTFNYERSVDGLRQILWGLFKKIVIADGSAEYANMIFNSSEDYSGSMLIVGALFFTFQIYGDFSGYSDIAIGTSRLFGFDLKKNFAFPYFSRDIAEFWRRWHISLSTWFRDYLYIPLGGSKGGLWMKIRNTFIIFLVSGFWHGANWTFVAWGALNAIYFLPLLLTKSNRRNLENIGQGKYFPSVYEFIGMITTFSLTVFGWILFRANDLNHAWYFIKNIFTKDLFKAPKLPDEASIVVYAIYFMIIIEWLGRENNFALEKFGMRWYRPFRWLFYIVTFLLCIILMGKQQAFIYFQF